MRVIALAVAVVSVSCSSEQFEIIEKKGVIYMPVFYITIYVFGLKFNQPVYGKKSDYTDDELREIMERHQKETRLKLYALGYTG